MMEIDKGGTQNRTSTSVITSTGRENCTSAIALCSIDADAGTPPDATAASIARCTFLAPRRSSPGIPSQLPSSRESGTSRCYGARWERVAVFRCPALTFSQVTPMLGRVASIRQEMTVYAVYSYLRGCLWSLFLRLYRRRLSRQAVSCARYRLSLSASCSAPIIQGVRQK